jgi:hypothetical protein
MNQDRITISQNDTDLKSLIVYSNFEPYYNKLIDDKQLKISKKKYAYEKKNLDYLKIEIIKNLIYLDEVLIQNGMDASRKLNLLINDLFDTCSLNNPSEDLNYLLIVSRTS